MKISKVSQKTFELYPYIIILLKTNTPKYASVKLLLALVHMFQSRKKKIQHVEVSFGIPHKWGILIKQNQIWMALKEKTKLACFKSRQ